MDPAYVKHGPEESAALWQTGIKSAAHVFQRSLGMTEETKKKSEVAAAKHAVRPGAEAARQMVDMDNPEIAPDMLSCVPMSPDEQLEFLTQTPDEEEVIAENRLGQTFQLHAWILRRIAPFDPVTGEYKPAVQTTLVFADGERLRFSSKGIFQSLLKLVEFKGRGPWKPGIPVIVNRQYTSQSRPFFTLSFVREQKAK